VLLTIIVATIIATNLRSGWIALLTMMVYNLIKMPKQFMRLAVRMFLGIGVLISSVLILKPDIVTKIIVAAEESYVSSTDESTSTLVFREMLNVAYFNNMTTTGFILGMPAGEMPTIPLTLSSGETKDSVGLHNQYMSFLYYTGIFGLISFLILNITMIRRLFVSCRIIPERKDDYEILLVGIIVYIPFSYANTFDPLYPILMALGTSFAIIQNPSNEVVNLQNNVSTLS
jgi:O-antigen ligase